MLEFRDVTSIQIRPSTCRVFLSSFLSSQYRQLHPVSFLSTAGSDGPNNWPESDLSEGISITEISNVNNEIVVESSVAGEPEFYIGTIADEYWEAELEMVADNSSSSEPEVKPDEVLADEKLEEKPNDEGKRVVTDPPRIFWEDPYPANQRNHSFVQYSNWRLIEGGGGTW